MEYITGEINQEYSRVENLSNHIGETVRIQGIIHKIREMSDFSFILLRTGRHIVQCVYTSEYAKFNLSELSEGCALVVEGKVSQDDRVALGCEILIETIDIKAEAHEPLPLTINKKNLGLTLDVSLTNRPLSLRHPKERAVFKIQEGISRGFRDCLQKQKFTEIRTPKIVFAGAEGGANIFKLDYFGREVFLAQSPQFYKQIMVGVFERVYEVAPVYRAEKHSTSRHINEYVSMDFEMGFIKDFTDIMEMETVVLKYIIDLLNNEYSEELHLLGVSLPVIDKIPVMKFNKAKELVSQKFNRAITDFNDFDPEEEKLLSEIVKKAFDSDFIFVTHFPARKRPFYAMEDVNDPGYTLSFDLICKGLEITTGGQRIHNYEAQLEKMLSKEMNPELFDSYLMIHKYGIPPHGGLGLGLERLTMKLLNLPNIRNASLFPRDINRVTP